MLYLGDSSLLTALCRLQIEFWAGSRSLLEYSFPGSGINNEVVEALFYFFLACLHIMGECAFLHGNGNVPKYQPVGKQRTPNYTVLEAKETRQQNVLSIHVQPYGWGKQIRGSHSSGHVLKLSWYNGGLLRPPVFMCRLAQVHIDTLIEWRVGDLS